MIDQTLPSKNDGTTPSPFPIREGELKSQLICRLVDLLGLERVEQLAELVEEVVGETGYGHVTIIVSQGKVARLKAEKSY